jgi:hypothetical protein
VQPAGFFPERSVDRMAYVVKKAAHAASTARSIETGEEASSPNSMCHSSGELRRQNKVVTVSWYLPIVAGMIGGFYVIKLVRRAVFVIAVVLSGLGVSILVTATQPANAQSTDSILDIFGEP